MANIPELNTNQAADLNYWRPIIWSLRVYEEAKTKMYWNRFSGPEGSGMPVIVKSELITQPGQTINISQLANLTGAGVSGESMLRGNEEKLDIRQIQTSPEWYRHAVADTRKAAKQINQSFRLKATAALSYWMAKKLDTSMWTAARITAAAGFEAAAVERIYAGSGAVSVDTIDASDTMSVAVIRKAAAVLAAKDISPISIPGMPAGEGYFLLFIHPYHAHDLKADTEWIQNHRDASERGRDNPLFTGALGEIDGVIVHSTTQCTATANANSPSVNVAVAMMLGQEALCRGMNEDINWSEQMEDYDFQRGVGIGAAWEDKILSAYALLQVVAVAEQPS